MYCTVEFFTHGTGNFEQITGSICNLLDLLNYKSLQEPGYLEVVVSTST